jgi:hypothetical protein
MTTLITLAGINLNITSFLNASNNLTQDRRTYLVDINDRIKEMYEKNRRFSISEISNLSQDAIIEKHSLYLQTTIIDLLTFLKALINHLIIEKNKQTDRADNAYKDLITTIYDSTQGMIDAMDVMITKDAAGLYTISPCEDYFSLVVNFFGGRYQPFSQAMDPFSGMKKNMGLSNQVNGNCYGYVKSWANDIASNGLMTQMPRLDYKTLCEQKNQNSGFFKQTRRSLSGILFPWAADIGVKTDFPFLFNRLLSSLSHTQIYGLSFHFNSKPGHIIGIRFIAKQKEYEIFDPNVGIIVFGTKKHTQDWLIYDFFRNYKHHYIEDKTIKGSMILRSMAIQPLATRPSIPTFKTNNDRVDGLVDFYLENSKWPDNHALRDTSFWEKNRDTFKTIAWLYLMGLSATLAVLSLAMFLLALSNVTSIVIIGCVLSGPLIPAFVLGLGLASYAAYKLVDQYRYANSLGFFTKHSDKPSQSIAQDKTAYPILDLSKVTVT